MRRRAVVGAALLLLLTCAVAVVPGLRGDAASTVDLGTASAFAVLAGSAITNTGVTTITGDVGSFPTPAITGFDSVTLTGTNHGADSVTAQAKADLAIAYGVTAATPGTPIASELGGQQLTPGAYSAGTFAITGTLVLDTQGDPNAVFIFQASSTLVTAAASAVTILDGGAACNVFWQIGSSATLGADSQLIGSILAFTSITVGARATTGRLLARGAAVTLDSDAITTQPCAIPPTTTTEPATTTTEPSTTEPPTTTTEPTTTTTEPTTTTTEPTTTTIEPTTTTDAAATTTDPGATTTVELGATTSVASPAPITNPDATTTTDAGNAMPVAPTTARPVPVRGPSPPDLAVTGNDPRVPFAAALTVVVGLSLLAMSSPRRRTGPKT